MENKTEHMVPDHDPILSKKCMEIIPCDTARITKVGDRIFLIIGFDKNTKDDSGQWIEVLEDGSRINRDWDYTEEHCVAMGKTEDELIESAKEYQRLSKMTIAEYIQELKEGSNNGTKI